MKNIKRFKQFESTDWNLENEFVHDLEDITLELKDDGFLVDIRLNRSTRTNIRSVAKPSEYEVRISKPGGSSSIQNPGFIRWDEIKDSVIRLTEYCYQNGWSVRFWADGLQILSGCKKEEDFTSNRFIHFFSFRILVTRL